MRPLQDSLERRENPRARTLRRGPAGRKKDLELRGSEHSKPDEVAFGRLALRVRKESAEK